MDTAKPVQVERVTHVGLQLFTAECGLDVI